ncbi:4'-phosphopantetheinyl transferase family protein [Herbiconiux sp. P18]|uniref:4'-phosphopantetheinyl transferase family protein n=1 Tax=Herbiconiux liangxiaofengii TaxID=3342795 RepID=UPI0035B7B3CD
MTPQVHVRWVPLALGDDVDDGFSALLPRLTADERMRAETTSDLAAAARFVYGRIAVRHLAAELAPPAAGGEPLTADDVTVWALCPDCGGPHGRPQVDVRKPKGRSLSISIAHCRAGVAVAASWSGIVGIDVELADAPVDSMAAIAALVPPASRPAGTGWDPVQHWTRVEAVLKADGRGLRVDPAAVRVRREAGALSAVIDGPPNPALASAPGAPRRATDVEALAAPTYALADLRLDTAVRASVAILPRKATPRPAVPVVTWRPLHLAPTP